MMDVNDYAFIGQAVILITAAFGCAVIIFCCIKCGKDAEERLMGKGGENHAAD